MAQDASKYNVGAGMDAGRLRLAGAGMGIGAADAGSGAGIQDAQLLSQVGSDIVGRAQNQMDVDYGDFLEKRDWAKNQAMFGSNVLGGAPTGQSVTQNNPGGQGSKLGGAIGAGLTGWAATGNPYVGLAAGGASLLS